MCRIAGIIAEELNTEQLQQDVKAMCTFMTHGGPDGEGFYHDKLQNVHFGHRRLALIDLTIGGHQPMFYNDEKLVITYNGEIYNFLELKAELNKLNFKFNTASDTEVILAAYLAWGTACFDKLKGMFAFALHDKLNHSVYLVRDPAGIKPLYYSLENEKLVFASEVKAFKATAYNYRENPDWRVFFLAFGHIPEPYTTLDDVKMLPKGNYLEYNTSSGSSIITSYHVKDKPNSVKDPIEAQRLIETTLDAVVKRHLIADAPIGVFLSGGIDSSLLSLLAARHKSLSVNTLSINFEEEGFSEKKYQDLVNVMIKGEHASYTLNETFFNQHFPTAITAMDQPTADGINSWFINYFAKKNGLKAVLSGIGADEYFGGYPSFKRMKWVNALSHVPKAFLKAGRFFKASVLKRAYYLSYRNTAGKYLFLRGLFTPDEISRILGCSRKQVDETLYKLALRLPAGLEDEEQAAWLETNQYMQNQLLKDTDSMSMQHGVEVRVPFLDGEIATAMASITNEIKYGGERPKELLIESFKNLLPERIWNRKKMGFTFPFQYWLQTNEFFLNATSNLNPITAEFRTAFLKGKLHWSKALALLVMEDAKWKS